MINWGSQRVPNNGACIINDPGSVASAANKAIAFRRFSGSGVRCPEWTTDTAIAQGWSDNGGTVIVRHLVGASEGRGIEIVLPRGRVPRAPLYTKYVKKKYEYRVHVMRGEVIDYVEKKLRRGGTNALVRNTANGYIFAREGVELPADVRVQSIAAVRALGLDFGAVDVVFNERRGEAYVLEVNTAPGNTGTTTQRYAQALRRLWR
jgi:glutathione synthase/RimK-type ligase-like ATP-grasp enzyme